jgi:membrane protein DedA with SNARE-associated domain
VNDLLLVFWETDPFEAGRLFGRALAPVLIAIVVVIVAVWLWRRQRR